MHKPQDLVIAAQAFTEARDLIQRLRSELDVEHYTGYTERAAAIEAETQRRALAGELEWASAPAFIQEISEMGRLGHILHIGLTAKLGYESLREAEEHLLNYRYAEAESALRMAELQWESLGAKHILPQVWGTYGTLYMYSGNFDRAWAYLMRAREAARDVGNLRTETTALINLCILVLEMPEQAEFSPLDLLAQARAAANLLEQLYGGMPVQWDIGALDVLEATVSEWYGSIDVAESSLRRAITAAELVVARLKEPSSARMVLLRKLAGRWGKLGSLLVNQGRRKEMREVRSALLR